MKVFKAVMITLIIVVFCTSIGIISYKESKDEELNDAALSKAVEEFYFDYNEEIIVTDVKKTNKYHIITIYGEKTMATYIYKDGEIWNYENHSS